MQTKLLREIKIALPNLRKSEVKVAEFILNKPSAIIELTTAQASSEIGVSEPTLIRFCKAVNFDGFQKFKLTLAQQLAADDYFNSYEIDPEDSNSWDFRGRSKYWLNQYEEAIKDLDKAIEIDPEDWNSWHFRGVSKYFLKQYL